MNYVKPWILAPLELLQHAEDHKIAGSDFDKRMALVSYDNSIETSITTYLTLHPLQRSGVNYERKRVDDWLRNYHTKLQFFEQYLIINDQPIEITRDEIVWYHNLRNELYHSGNGMVPAEYNIQGIRNVALWVFSVLFNVDAKNLLNQNNQPSQTKFSQVHEISISGQMSFLKSYIEFESVLRATMKVLGLESKEEFPPTTERVWYIFKQFTSLPEGYDLIVQESQEVRDRILNNLSIEYSENELVILASRLDQVTQYTSNFVESIDILPLLLERYPGQIRPEILSVRLINRDLVTFLEVVTGGSNFKEVKITNLDFIVDELPDEVDEFGYPELVPFFRGDLSAEDNVRKLVENIESLGYLIDLFKNESSQEKANM